MINGDDLKLTIFEYCTLTKYVLIISEQVNVIAR